MTIILNSEVLFDLTVSNAIHLQRKKQPNTIASYNYYVTPKIGFGLHYPKVIEATPKYIVIQFDKVNCINLLALFRKVNTHLLNMCGIDSSIKVYDFFSEQESAFTLRCSLPGYKGNYFIDSDDASNPFKVPRKNSTLIYVEIDIRNIWQTEAKAGFNLELKKIKTEI